MSELPEPLVPTYHVDLDLPSGQRISLPHCSPRFPIWMSEPLCFTFGGKALLDWQGAAVFAEIYILRLLETAGWEGAWVSTYGGRKFLSEMPRDSSLGGVPSLPPERMAVIDRITDISGARGGCFDVFAWRGESIVFCEAKRKRQDRLQATQRRWLDAVLETGVPVSDLLVVEWAPAEG